MIEAEYHLLILGATALYFYIGGLVTYKGHADAYLCFSPDHVGYVFAGVFWPLYFLVKTVSSWIRKAIAWDRGNRHRVVVLEHDNKRLQERLDDWEKPRPRVSPTRDCHKITEDAMAAAADPYDQLLTPEPELLTPQPESTLPKPVYGRGGPQS